MRQIGHLETESAARTFGDYLIVQGIKNEIEMEKGLGWAVWVHAEEEMERAKQLLADYRANPKDAKFRAEAKATKLREREKEEQKAYEQRIRGRRHLFRPLREYGFGPLTFAMIVISVVVFVLSKMGDDPEAIMGLFVTKFDISGGYIQWERGLQEIRHGEIWRLFTPMFIHFGPIHILFNMLWLRDLGSMIEGRQSTWHLALFSLTVAALSNLGQYLVSGPHFGGMSGVVYGLLGYIWIRGKFDPASGLFVHKSTVTMMIVWFFLCFTPLLGHIANTAHAVGLGMGMAWGYLSSLKYR
ncbi:MAG: rhomboid family intramembrane serine protease [Verrucomicrobia bacterium]|nr:rhomboid family intramembrane serine protease [Verrucomicrobiota bacterium]